MGGEEKRKGDGKKNRKGVGHVSIMRVEKKKRKN